MAVFIKKYQYNNEQNENAHGKIFGRAVTVGEVEIEELANEIQENCTVKRSDILAVLSEIGPSIKKMVQKSYKVRIPYLGTFKLGVKSIGVENWDDYDVKKHIKGVKVMFRPEYTIENRHAVKEMTRGVTVALVPKTLAYLNDDAEGDGQTNTNQGGTINDQP
jgi:predicted histone-like DNA-binding protein